MSKRKFYVVWKGRKTGVFTSWNACKRQIDGEQIAKGRATSKKKAEEQASKRVYYAFQSEISVS